MGGGVKGVGGEGLHDGWGEETPSREGRKRGNMRERCQLQTSFKYVHENVIICSSTVFFRKLMSEIKTSNAFKLRVICSVNLMRQVQNYIFY